MLLSACWRDREALQLSSMHLYLHPTRPVIHANEKPPWTQARDQIRVGNETVTNRIGVGRAQGDAHDAGPRAFLAQLFGQGANAQLASSQDYPG